MNKLNNVNRTGGYPLVGENLKILAEDYPKYITGILNGLDLPEKTCVFLQMNTSTTNMLTDSLVYITHGSSSGQSKASQFGLSNLTKGDIYMLRVNNTNVNAYDLLSGIQKMGISFTTNNFSITGFSNITTNQEAVLINDSNSVFNFISYSDALRYIVLNETNYDLSGVSVGVYTNNVLSSPPSIKNESQIRNGAINTSFDNILKIQNGHCFIQLGTINTKKVNNDEKVVIKLPDSFMVNGYLPVMIGCNNIVTLDINRISRFYSRNYTLGYLINNFIIYDAVDYDMQYITLSYFASKADSFNAYSYVGGVGYHNNSI
ncbi:MAG: hypothetical protein LBQ22_01865 [Bacteroidales bacterium]|jgi:hypothetical protein|nr:hypothetical protein [Bacteroidales bacterium]